VSNYLAIATVTAALQSLLQRDLGVDVPGATVTTVRPDSADNALPDPGANVFLYQVTPNSAWRNTDLPTRTSAGHLVQRPRVALDLHYLLTFYGAELDLEPQRALGSAARTLHAQSLLTRQQIQETITAATDVDPEHFLGRSDLVEEVELVKFMPLSLSLEELSKLWSVFFQTPYSLSMAYLASTVLIEPDEAPRRVLPVRVRSLSVLPFQQAHIEKVVSTAGETEPVVVGDTIRITGQGLGGSIAGVRVGDALLSPAEVSAREILVELVGSGLRAGVQGVQVIYTSGAESNVASLILRPVIPQDAEGVYAIDVSDVEIDLDDDTRAATITVSVAPAVGPRQRAFLFLNQRPPTAEPVRAYQFQAEARDAETDTLRFAADSLAAGDYLVRVQVGGAESLLEIDDDGFYSQPEVTIP